MLIPLSAEGRSILPKPKFFTIRPSALADKVFVNVWPSVLSYKCLVLNLDNRVRNPE